MTRRKLPDRRASWTQSVQIPEANGKLTRFYLSFGEYPDGTLGEIWLLAKHEGTFVSGILGALARTVSLALQDGATIGEVCNMLGGLDYPPQGEVVSEHSSVKHCTSLSDWVAQEIRAHYGTILPTVGNHPGVDPEPEPPATPPEPPAEDDDTTDTPLAPAEDVWGESDLRRAWRAYCLRLSAREAVMHTFQLAAPQPPPSSEAFDGTYPLSNAAERVAGWRERPGVPGERSFQV